MPFVADRIKKITNLLSKEQTQILETSFILMLPVLLTKVTGQIFNLILTSFYSGSDPRINQFFIANSIPELLTTVLMIGAVGTVIIPVLESARAKKGKEYFYKVYSSIVNLAVIVFVVISAIIFVFADEFIPLAIDLVGSSIEPGSASLNNIVWMMRALILPQLVLGISVFISTGLNIYDRYLLPQLSPLFYNLGRIIVVIFLISLLDKSPWAIVLATYVGSFFHLIIQIPLFLKLKIKYYFRIDYKNEDVREILHLGAPRILVLASEQFAFLFSNFISLAFIAGPAALNYAKSLYLVIPSLFGYTFSYSSYPTLSRLFLKKDHPKIRNIVKKTLNEIFFLAIPFTIVLMVLRVPIVRVVYGIIPNTAFTLQDTYQVAWILLFFSFGLVFITARWFLFRLFYSAKDTITPSIISVFSLVGVISLSFIFSNLLSYNDSFSLRSIDFSVNHLLERSDVANRAGVGGIPLAMSIVYTVEFLAMLYLFNRKKVNLGLRNLVSTLYDKFLAGAFMFGFMYITYRFWSVLSYLPESATVDYRGSTTLNLIILMIITILPGFMIYFLICHLLKVEELKILRKYLNPVFKLGGLRIR